MISRRLLSAGLACGLLLASLTSQAQSLALPTNQAELINTRLTKFDDSAQQLSLQRQRLQQVENSRSRANQRAQLLMAEFKDLQQQQPDTNGQPAELAELERNRHQNQLNQKKQQLRSLAQQIKQFRAQADQLTQAIALRETNLIAEQSELMPLIMQQYQRNQRQINRSTEYECGDTAKNDCKAAAKNLILRELADELSGVSLVSETLVENFQVNSDKVKTQSQQDFSSVKVSQSTFTAGADGPILTLSLLVKIESYFTEQQLAQMEQHINLLLSQKISPP